jgi:glycosyl transferase family 25
MTAMDDLHTWVINLDKDRERWQRIAAQCAEHLAPAGLAWTRISAVSGRDLSEAERTRSLDVNGYRRRHGKEPVLGELGCYLSHLAVMRALLASPCRYALVLEDDALLTPALAPALQALRAHPGRWDMVKLSQVHRGTPRPVLTLAPGLQLAVMLSRCTGSSAYLVNRRAAEAYLQRLLPMQLPYDHVFDRGWDLGLKVRLAVPTPCIHDEACATTITAAGRRKFPWYRRWPAYRWRLHNEARRLVYGLRETWRERRADGG